MPRHTPVDHLGVVRARQVNDVELIIIAVEHHLNITVLIEVLKHEGGVNVSRQTQHWKSQRN